MFQHWDLFQDQRTTGTAQDNKPVGEIIEQHNVNYHYYADDIQMYSSLKPGDK